MNLHILGVCGTFMSGIAVLAKQSGYHVTGSDLNVYPPMSIQLEEQGIELMSGFDPSHIAPNVDCVIVGNIVKRGNPAMEYIMNQRIPYISGPQWLAETLLKDRWVLAVAGTHGKTTTTSLLTWILETAGLNPGFLIGGVPENFGVSARIGSSPYFVIEADEYDCAFFDKRAKFIFKFIHHDDIGKIKKAFRRRAPHDNKPIIYRIKRKEGEFRWFESNIRLIMNEQTNTVSEIQLASRDITDRVLDKKARLRGQQLAHVFRLSTMEEMASGMAHEISQPLAAIVNYTRGCVRHLANNSHDQDQLRSVMEKAVAQAERAGEIIQRLKNFFCKGQLVKTSCKVSNVVRETVSLLKNELTISKTKIDFNFDKNTPFIFIDKIQIQQVLLNLIQNSIEAMQENYIKEKRIHIQTELTSTDTIEVIIHDTGPGFSKDVVHKAFTPFFTTKAHGRGMGLSICRSIIEAHGGQFTINPNTNNDSWIQFSLPISI